MQNENLYVQWLERPDNSPIAFEDLALMLAEVRHPPSGDENSDDDLSIGLAWLQFESDLERAVSDGRLKVRNPLTGDFHTFPLGNALKKSVVFPLQDLRPYLEQIGIGLRLTPEAATKVVAVQRNASQDALVLRKLRELGFDPKALPKAKPGKPGVRNAVRKALGGFSDSVFKKSWQRLRNDGEIAES